MDRRFVEAALLALLAIAAVAAAAATLPTATESGGSGAGSGLPFEGEGGGGLLPLAEPPEGPLIDLPDLGWLLSVITAVLLLAALVYAYVYRRELVRPLVYLTVLFVLGALLVWLGSVSPAEPADLPVGNGSILGGPVGSAGGQSPTVRPLLLLVFVAVVGAGALAILLRTDRVDLAGTSATEDGPPSAEAAAVGEAAGRAADRIEGTDDLDNEIYRAWREMTELLAVPRPGTSTPGEFAAAAVDAGMAGDDVAELTRLFEDVRYGGDEPTAAAEGRALAILRRIEATYVPDGEEP